MCEFHDSNCNGFGDMRWTDKCTYFISIDNFEKYKQRPKSYSSIIGEQLMYFKYRKYFGNVRVVTSHVL